MRVGPDDVSNAPVAREAVGDAVDADSLLRRRQRNEHPLEPRASSSSGPDGVEVDLGQFSSSLSVHLELQLGLPLMRSMLLPSHPVHVHHGSRGEEAGCAVVVECWLGFCLGRFRLCLPALLWHLSLLEVYQLEFLHFFEESHHVLCLECPPPRLNLADRSHEELPLPPLCQQLPGPPPLPHPADESLDLDRRMLPRVVDVLPPSLPLRARHHSPEP
mmetsp:Transcript_18316/g.41695  ORF Transcript_18316/g.41695 Transcript_18316/m.41695 type:complete len:217 (+) Transcript_18316:303-953(+)